MKYRNQLPQLNGYKMLTDGGLETDLYFNHGIELPEFAAFPLVKSTNGTAVLEHYFQAYVDIARKYEMGLILESPTWRANADWGTKIGYNQSEVDEFIQLGIKLLDRIRHANEVTCSPMPVSGCVGPRGDGYVADSLMSVEEAEAYHFHQINVIEKAGADLVSALTLNYTEEAIGIIRAARCCNIPVVISFTVETDGCLPSGMSLLEAISKCDEETDGYCAYYMINCAHPTHFKHVLEGDRTAVSRIRGIRANASKKCHAELDEATELDDGCPCELGRDFAELVSLAPEISVFGGCCGTDHRHLEAIAQNVAHQHCQLV